MKQWHVTTCSQFGYSIRLPAWIWINSLYSSVFTNQHLLWLPAYPSQCTRPTCPHYYWQRTGGAGKGYLIDNKYMRYFYTCSKSQHMCHKIRNKRWKSAAWARCKSALSYPVLMFLFINPLLAVLLDSQKSKTSASSPEFPYPWSWVYTVLQIVVPSLVQDPH